MFLTEMARRAGFAEDCRTLRELIEDAMQTREKKKLIYLIAILRVSVLFPWRAEECVDEECKVFLQDMRTILIIEAGESS